MSSFKKIILCEKPSVAKDIASFLGSNIKDNGFYKGGEYIVTWAFGHLVTLENAKAYTENPWNIESIPIFPKEFKYRLINNSGVKKQFKIIEHLFSKAELIINACDAGREGELIFRNIYYHCKAPSKNVNRLWVSSFEKKEIEKAFNSIKSQNEYQNLYNAALSRNLADWIIGINGTVLLTKILNSTNVLSIGRVQTPTFIAVTQRYLDNKNFKPKTFFIPLVKLVKDNIEFTAEYKQRFSDEALSKKIIDFSDTSLKCNKVVNSIINEKTPLLLDLSTIQKKSNQIFGFTASKTLDIMQVLYEKHKIITYPRTDSRYISIEKFQSIPDLLKGISSYDLENYSNYLNIIDFNNLPKACVNDKKISDHHAVIPTGNIPKNLNEDELKIFDLIIKYFVAAFCPVCEKNKTDLEFTNSANNVFVSSGTTIISLGWRNILKDDKKYKQLPNISENEIIEIKSKENYRGFTNAPKIFNDSSLLIFMETCGKDFSGEEIPASVKAKGIGTQPGRDKIIERIISLNYIKRNKKHLIPTEKGLKLFNLIKDFSISNIDMTGDWEQKLDLINKGEYDFNVFLSEIKNNFSSELLTQLKNLKGSSFNDVIKCPKCKQKTLLDSGKLYKCIDETCKFVFWKEIFHKKITAEQTKQLLNLEIVEIKKLKGKKDTEFSAKVYIDTENDFKISLKFDKKKIVDTDLMCPKCGAGKIIDSEKAFGCNQYKNGCQFVVFKNIAGHKIKLDEVKQLIQLKKTDVIKDFISQKTNKNFSANLILDKDFKVQFQFPSK